MFNARECSYLETLVKDIHFQQIEIAAARSPCSGSKTSVLHFKVKNTPLQLKDKKWRKKVQRMFSFLFVEEWKLFIKKSSVLKCNQGSEVFAEFSGTFCSLWSRKLRF